MSAPSEPNICPTCINGYRVVNGGTNDERYEPCPDPFHKVSEPNCKHDRPIENCLLCLTDKAFKVSEPNELLALITHYNDWIATTVGLAVKNPVEPITAEELIAQIEALIAKRERAVVDRLQKAIAPKRISKKTIDEVLS